MNDPIESFDYFVGKVCTIHTKPTNWGLTPEGLLDYYTGIVDSVNECGICMTNVVNRKKTFIMMPAVIAIAEETMIEGGKEEHEASVKDYDAKKRDIFKHNPAIIPQAIPPAAARKPVTKVNDSPYVNIDAMTAHVRAAKERYK